MIHSAISKRKGFGLRAAGLFALAAGFAALGSPQPVQAADQYGIERQTGIPFATVDEHDLMLDLYMPAGAANPPLLVWVHGGAWWGGSRDRVDTEALVNAGYAIASIDYRSSRMAKFPAPIHDIKGAIRFLRAHALEYGYDGARIGIMGRSAGAHLAALVGVTNSEAAYEGEVGGNLDQGSSVRTIVSYFGASNLTTILNQSTPYGLIDRAPAVALLLGGTPEDAPEAARMASPVFQVDASDPPLFLLHGDQDPDMPINQAHELQWAYEEKGLPVTFEVVHGAEHGGDLFFDAERTALVRAFLDQYLRDVPLN